MMSKDGCNLVLSRIAKDGNRVRVISLMLTLPLNPRTRPDLASVVN